MREEWEKQKGLGTEEERELVLDIPSPRKLEDRKVVSRGYSNHRTRSAHPANVYIEKEGVQRMGPQHFSVRRPASS